MTEFDDQPELQGPIYPFIPLSSYRILVCQVCGFASVADEAKSHLLARHRDLTSEHRQAVSERIQKIPNILRKQSDLKELQYPHPTSDPIPHLVPPQLDGLRCRTCSRVYRHVQQMQAHCSEEHQWVNPRGKGRPNTSCAAPPDELPWIKGIPCQRFFSSRGGSRWFEVGRNTFKLTVFRPQKEVLVLDPLEELESLGPQAHIAAGHGSCNRVGINSTQTQHLTMEWVSRSIGTRSPSARPTPRTCSTTRRCRRRIAPGTTR